jgi:APA family basic amino acid/polyamine antiporter
MCLALVVGNVIGTGIFLLPAQLAPYGVNALFGFGVTIAGSLCLAFVFAALARGMPEADGAYDYVAGAIGAPAAFFVLWSYWISLWVTNAAIAIGAVSYLTVLAPGLRAVPAAGPLLAIGFVILFTGIASLGARASGGVQLVTAILKILPLAAVIVLGFALLGGGTHEAQPLAPLPVSGGSIAGAAALSLWVMLGFESAVMPAGKVRDPARTIPRATLAGTLLVGLIYLFATASVFLLLPFEVAARSDAPFSDLVARHWGAGAGSAIAAFAAISALGALNGWVLLQAEVPLGLARAGIFPRSFARVNRAGMPVFGQWLGCALTTLLIGTNLSRGLAGVYAFMILLATVATLVLYAAASASALALLRRRRLSGVLLALAATLGGVYSLWTLWGAGAEAVGWGAALLASGVPVYLLMRRGAGSSRAAASSAAAPPGSAA